MRRKDREITEIGEILDIVGTAKILHLGLFDGEFPYVVPLHYGFAYEDSALVFFLHGAVEGHKLDLIRSDPRACVQLEMDAELISGGENPCKYGAAYASVIGRGRAEIVGGEEAVRGLRLLMKHQTGRDFDIRPEMLAAVAVIKVVVPTFTAKARKKPGPG